MAPRAAAPERARARRLAAGAARLLGLDRRRARLLGRRLRGSATAGAGSALTGSTGAEVGGASSGTTSPACGGRSSIDGGISGSKSRDGGMSAGAGSVSTAGGSSSRLSTSRAVRRRITLTRRRVSVVCSMAVTSWSAARVALRDHPLGHHPLGAERDRRPLGEAEALPESGTSSSVSALCDRLPRSPTRSAIARRSFGF